MVSAPMKVEWSILEEFISVCGMVIVGGEVYNSTLTKIYLRLFLLLMSVFS